jgi:hypothetical protein
LQLHEGDLETLPPKPSTGTSILDFTAVDEHALSRNSQVRLWEARRLLADLAVEDQQALADGPELARRLKASAREIGSRLFRQFEGSGQNALDAVEEDMKKKIPPPSLLPTAGIPATTNALRNMMQQRLLMRNDSFSKSFPAQLVV